MNNREIIGLLKPDVPVMMFLDSSSQFYEILTRIQEYALPNLNIVRYDFHLAQSADGFIVTTRHNIVNKLKPEQKKRTILVLDDMDLAPYDRMALQDVTVIPAEGLLPLVGKFFDFKQAYKEEAIDEFEYEMLYTACLGREPSIAAEELDRQLEEAFSEEAGSEVAEKTVSEGAGFGVAEKTVNEGADSGVAEKAVSEEVEAGVSMESPIDKLPQDEQAVEEDLEISSVVEGPAEETPKKSAEEEEPKEESVEKSTEDEPTRKEPEEESVEESKDELVEEPVEEESTEESAEETVEGNRKDEHYDSDATPDVSLINSFDNDPFDSKSDDLFDDSEEQQELTQEGSGLGILIPVAPAAESPRSNSEMAFKMMQGGNSDDDSIVAAAVDIGADFGFGKYDSDLSDMSLSELLIDDGTADEEPSSMDASEDSDDTEQNSKDNFEMVDLEVTSRPVEEVEEEPTEDAKRAPIEEPMDEPTEDAEKESMEDTVDPQENILIPAPQVAYEEQTQSVLEIEEQEKIKAIRNIVLSGQASRDIIDTVFASGLITQEEYDQIVGIQDIAEEMVTKEKPIEEEVADSENLAEEEVSLVEEVVMEPQLEEKIESSDILDDGMHAGYISAGESSESFSILIEQAEELVQGKATDEQLEESKEMPVDDPEEMQNEQLEAVQKKTQNEQSDEKIQDFEIATASVSIEDKVADIFAKASNRPIKEESVVIEEEPEIDLDNLFDNQNVAIEPVEESTASINIDDVNAIDFIPLTEEEALVHVEAPKKSEKTPLFARLDQEVLEDQEEFDHTAEFQELNKIRDQISQGAKAAAYKKLQDEKSSVREIPAESISNEIAREESSFDEELANYSQDLHEANLIHIEDSEYSEIDSIIDTSEAIGGAEAMFNPFASKKEDIFKAINQMPSEIKREVRKPVHEGVAKPAKKVSVRDKETSISSAQAEILASQMQMLQQQINRLRGDQERNQDELRELSRETHDVKTQVEIQRAIGNNNTAIATSRGIIPHNQETKGSQFVAQVRDFNQKIDLARITPKLASAKAVVKAKPKKAVHKMGVQRVNTSRLVVFGGLSRKCGASSFAYNYACELSKLPTRRVILIDLDFNSAGLSTMLYNQYGMSFTDSNGIENILGISGNDYLQKMDLLTASIATPNGDELRFIRSSNAYPYQVKDVLARADYSKLFDILKQLYTDIVVDVGNFISPDRYKTNLFSSAAKVVALFDCKNERSYVTSFDSMINIPRFAELILVNYTPRVNYITLGKESGRSVSGMMNSSSALLNGVNVPIYESITQDGISQSWASLLTNIMI